MRGEQIAKGWQLRGMWVGALMCPWEVPVGKVFLLEKKHGEVTTE